MVGRKSGLFTWLEFPHPSKGKQSGWGKGKVSLCLWKVQLLPPAPCLEGALRLHVWGSSHMFVLEGTRRVWSAKPASEIRKQSTMSDIANCCDKTLCRSICWLPPTSRGSAQVLTFVLPEDPVNVSLGEWGVRGLESWLDLSSCHLPLMLAVSD